MKSKKIMVIAVCIFLMIGCIIGYFLFQQQQEGKRTTEKISEISKYEKDFESSEEHDQKLEILKSVILEQKDYNQSKQTDNEVTSKYKSLISIMQKDFTTEYDNTIKEYTVDDLDNTKDIDTLSSNSEKLSALLTTIEAEKDYTLSDDSEYQEYTDKISSLKESYSNRINAIEEEQKAEEARKKAEEEQAKTHYENDYFSVDVPKEWGGNWTLTEEDNSSGSIKSTIYMFSYNPANGSGGGASVYVLDMSDTSISLPTYATMIPAECEEIGFTSSGYYDIFKTEAGAGFFSAGATITLK